MEVVRRRRFLEKFLVACNYIPFGFEVSVHLVVYLPLLQMVLKVWLEIADTRWASLWWVFFLVEVAVGFDHQVEYLPLLQMAVA